MTEKQEEQEEQVERGDYCVIFRESVYRWTRKFFSALAEAESFKAAKDTEDQKPAEPGETKFKADAFMREYFVVTQGCKQPYPSQRMAALAAAKFNEEHPELGGNGATVAIKNPMIEGLPVELLYE
jgi:hypothetical protein